MFTWQPEPGGGSKAKRLRSARNGQGGSVSVNPTEVHPLADYSAADPFNLIVLATKARDAIEAAPKLPEMLAPGVSLLPIQNGGVSQMLQTRSERSVCSVGFQTLAPP